MAQFASQVKTHWSISPTGLLKHAQRVGEHAFRRLRSQGFDDAVLIQSKLPRRPVLLRLDPDVESLLLRGSISPIPLHKVLILLEEIRAEHDSPYFDHERLALAKALVHYISNLEFGPEVGVGPQRSDAQVVMAWLNCISEMADDLKELGDLDDVPAKAIAADSRSIDCALPPESIDAVITSPPYPNEKDYTRTTRLESVLLGFIRNKQELRAVKSGLIRSNTRNVYASDTDDEWVASDCRIRQIAEAIEARRVALGKTSGFERLYARVAKLYFGGMARHLKSLQKVLRPGAKLAYVVGDQASYLRVMIPTGQILANIAEALGYHIVDIDLFRTRLSTATREQLREEVVVLQWGRRR